MPRITLLAACLVSSLACGAPSAPAAPLQPQAEALQLARQAMALRSVSGPGNQTPQVAALFGAALAAHGFRPQDITITPVDDTAYLVARWPGSDATLKPLVISGHMDVVAARREDWQRDPFAPVVENGFLHGRGATDMKLSDAMVIAALGALRHEGFRPRRDIILAFSGDEETAMKTGALLAGQLAHAELVLNVDGASGALDERTGKPAYFAWEGAEKTYADYRLTVTNPGGHSSAPRTVNAIDQLATALLRIQAHHFTPQINALTRSYLTHAAHWQRPAVAQAMLAFAKDPTDAAASAVLRAEPELVGTIGTTCVVTMISGGHAQNALPQRAQANVNCRIFPGHSRKAILDELAAVVADPAVRIEDVTEGSVATAASPMRADVVEALEHAVHAVYPGLPVFAAMSSGASDSMWFRQRGVPSYGMGPLFIKASEDFSHGLDERSPTASIAPGITILMHVVQALSR